MVAIDAWALKQPDKPGRPAAIRRLVKAALGHPVLKRAPNKETARTASILAAREIQNLADTSQPFDEQQRRKRRLIRGPSEFRDIRADQPKRKG
jgi:hypothetical protein